MPPLVWDRTGERFYETGIDHGVLYDLDPAGEYVDGVAWNGLIGVTESPTGAEVTPTYADNIKYLSLVSAEQFGATIEAYTYPIEFEKHDGSVAPTAGVSIGQQSRKTFGFSYRTLKGNDIDGTDHGYKLHLIYGALASPSEKNYATVNDTPEAITFSWEITTTPVEVGTVGGTPYKPTASITIDSTTVDPARLAILEEQLYGTVSEIPSMPSPADVITMMTTTLTEAVPTAPTFDSGTDTITFPVVTGVVYKVNGVTQTVPLVITVNTMVRAYPVTGYKFPAVVDDEWVFTV